ncbi:LysR family transcriptional regulator [Sneathiella marina]|uniref:LysR family transcriptional regulator n=1 Tax=Sneathiella marina TaxID=2950108 RepID=A0ABY4W3F3_9PROT|nr:LysR family transcriptional regulator [Sneathiella marina]USG61723.1 LysR family transcriptional regulator [Sneathiella marina]
MNWNDLKYYLAIVRQGTLSSAARELGVNQTTVSRRLNILEKQLETPLIQKIDGKYIPTDIGQKIFEHTQSIELDAVAITHIVTDQDTSPSGIVRVTAVESLINHFLIPKIELFHDQFPNIKIEFIADSENLQLNRRQADVAIRLARPTEGDMVISKLAQIGFSIYGSSVYVSEYRAEKFEDRPWVAYTESLAQLPEMRWLASNVKNADIRLMSGSALSLATAIRAGVGIGILPCQLGDPFPGICRLSEDEPIVSREAWLLINKDLRNTPRVRHFADWLKRTVSENVNFLSGETINSPK